MVHISTYAHNISQKSRHRSRNRQSHTSPPNRPYRSIPLRRRRPRRPRPRRRWDLPRTSRRGRCVHRSAEAGGVAGAVGDAERAVAPGRCGGRLPHLGDVVDHRRCVPQAAVRGFEDELQRRERGVAGADVALEVHASLDGPVEDVETDVG